jgi:hypothetical protein
MTRPNERLLRTAWLIEHQTALLVTHALEHWRDELRTLDGYPGGSDAPKVMSTAELTSVERVADMRITLLDDREELRDRLTGIEIAVADLTHWLRTRLGTRLPRHIAPLCGEWGGRKPWEGHMLPWTPGAHDDANGWHDATCRQAAGWSGLCPTCLKRMNRWRARHGLDHITEGHEVAA